jgi:exosome complex component RRP42
MQVEVTSLASAARHGADTRDLSLALTHQLQEQLCTPSFLDPKTLCLQPGKHCWHILVDVRVLNDDGGLLDACLLAASFALMSVQACTPPSP